ncbi:MAG TPA: hypothetical protein VFW66_08510 [Gemmatimonadales bacterium]|nr:hypothetical protein [Gemmatimonadales bacterium]
MPPAHAAALRALVTQRFPDALAAPYWSRGIVATGLAALDRILPNGGFQRGRLAAWEPGTGTVALLRSAALHATADGERTAWITTGGRLAPAGAGWHAGPLLLSSPGPLAGFRAAETLARSGGFAFVVVDGAEPDPAAAVRLSRAAHEGGAALVLVARRSPVASLRLESRALPQACGWQDRLGEPGAVRSVRVRVTARGSGWLAAAELVLPVWHDDRRLSHEPRHPDRRGERR